MSEARHILENYLQRTGLRHSSDAAQQFQVTMIRQWAEHLDEVLEQNLPGDPETRHRIIREFMYGALPSDAEAQLRVSMHRDMTYWADAYRSLWKGTPP